MLPAKHPYSPFSQPGSPQSCALKTRGQAQHWPRLTKFLGALALTGQFPHLHQRIEVALGCIGHT